jgi:NADH dehydrogenase FAD-containing subunit
LQLKDDEKSIRKLNDVFALGDVAETGGRKVARAGLMQAEIVWGNIVALIKGKKLDDYVSVFAEGMLKLSLGKVGYILTLMNMALQWELILSDNKDENVIYVQDRVVEMLIPGKSSNVDLEIARIWRWLGANLKDASA